MPVKKAKKKAAQKKPSGRYELVSFRVNSEEMAKIEGAIPSGETKNVFLRELVLSALQS